MSERSSHIALNAVMRVFETATFMNVFPCDPDADSRVPPSRISAAISFRGNRGGSVHLCVDEKMLRPLAANMLGEGEEGLQRDSGLDALKEITNMICGTFLTLYYGNDAVFSLNPPIIETVDCAGHTEEELVRILFYIEGTLAELIVRESNPV